MKSNPPRGERVGFTGIALLVSIALFSSACGKKKSPQAFERPPAPVTVAQCVAREVVSIQPQLSGRVTQLHFADGANLKKGDLLFTIDPRPFEAQLHASQADLA